jgi:16S rRNA (guanine527-N7)-methyltransferase
VKHPTIGPSLDADARTLGVELSPAAVSRLETFEGLLVDRAIPLGLVAASDAGRLRERHLLDCLRAVACVLESDADAMDLGAGAGLPGLVVAISRPNLAVHLVEPRRRRAAFLELAIETLGIHNAEVRLSRIEEVPDVVDLCFARAFAPLPDAWAAARPHLRPSGRLVYFAGAGTGTVAPLPGARAARTLEAPLLESSGPLIIMTR